MDDDVWVDICSREYASRESANILVVVNSTINGMRIEIGISRAWVSELLHIVIVDIALVVRVVYRILTGYLFVVVTLSRLSTAWARYYSLIIVRRLLQGYSRLINNYTKFIYPILLTYFMI